VSNFADDPAVLNCFDICATWHDLTTTEEGYSARR
jgi:hypothetical protein